MKKLLLAFVAAKIGWRSVVPQLKTVWIGLPLILALCMVRLVLQTFSWATALRREGITASAMSLAGIRLAAPGMGYVTPLGAAISEPIKIRLHAGRPTTAAVATLVDTGWFASACSASSPASTPR